MKKQLIKFASIVMCLMIVLTNVVWAMPGEGVKPNKTYNGNADLPWTATNNETGLTWKKAEDYLNGAYYNISGTAADDFKGTNGPYIGIPTGGTPNVYEMDFMIGNESSGFAMRMRTTSDSGSTKNSAFNAFTNWTVGTEIGNTVLEADKWYRMAVVFTVKNTDKMAWDVYLDGEKVLSSAGDIKGEEPGFIRVFPCVNKDKVLDVSFDNIYAYISDTYYAGAASEITSVNEEAGILDAANKTIKVNRGITAKELKANIVTDGTKIYVYKDTDNGVAENDEVRSGHLLAIRSADNRLTYYTLEDSYYVKYDFDNVAYDVALDNGILTTVTDTERNSKVLQIESTSTSGSTGFAVKNLKFDTSYVIAFDLKREGNSSVSMSWNGSANRIISIYTNSVQLFCNDIITSGNRPGEWTKYAAYVNSAEKKAQLYINGVAIGGEMDLSEYTKKITPVMDYPSFRFFLQPADTKVWVDNFELYPATPEDAKKLTKPAISVKAVEESGITVMSVPGAMGKIAGAVGTDIANLGTILTSGKNVTLGIYAADGTPVTEGVIENGMVLKAAKGGITSVYTFTDEKAVILSKEIGDGRFSFAMDSFDSNAVIIATYNEDGSLANINASNTTAGYYSREATYVNGQKVKAFVWENAQNMNPLFIIE